MSQPMTTLQDAPVLERARAGDVSGPVLGELLAAEADLTSADLSGANLDGADRTGLSLFKASLRGASLRNADLTNVELSGADLEGADLEGARLAGAGLGMARLVDVNAFNADLSNTTLNGADLTKGYFNCAILRGARLRETNLASTDFRSADLRDAELSLSQVGGACFDDADLRGSRLRGIGDFESASWYGVDLRDINFAGAYRLRRHIIDENYLREFREAGRLQGVLYEVWRVTSDCGRSLGRWVIIIALVVLTFAGLFAMAGLDTGSHPPGVMTWLYYSTVTLTSLGYGDVLPVSAFGQVLVMIEVALGYTLLGGLISILANKMARRGE